MGKRDQRKAKRPAGHDSAEQPEGRRLIDQLQEANRQLVSAGLRLQEMAEQAEMARERAEADHMRAAFLAEATDLLSVSFDYEATLATVARRAVPTFADWCLIEVNEDDGMSHRVGIAHAEPARSPLAAALQSLVPDRTSPASPRAKVLSTGRPVLMSEVSETMLSDAAQSEEHLRVITAIGPRSWIVAPLVARERRLGVLTFWCTDDSGRRYSEKDVPLVQELARRCALAVDNAQLYTRATESNRLKDEFLAMLSHELRTPLNAILGWSRMLRTGVLTAAKRNRALETIERNTKAQAQLVEDLLDISRIVTGKLRLNTQPVDLIAVIGGAVDVVRPAADNKGVKLEVFLDPTATPISGDADRLQQVFWNLLSNAVKFTPGGGRITIRLQRIESHMEISISDTGEGIPLHFLPYVFDPFRQAVGGTTRPHPGLGLGLAIVRRLVELHGGVVKAESSGGEGQGATFTVILPAKSHATGADFVEREINHSFVQDRTVSDLTRLRVLVVEDERDSRELLTLVLTQFGATVTAVGSADEALKAIQQHEPDALVADIGLPDQDGFTLMRKIRSMERKGARMPAIAVTAYASLNDRQQAIDAGYDDHVGKPIEPDRVAAVLATVIQPPGKGTR